MDRLSQRLLLNAEPFGFGPTAAIAGFFPHLRPQFETIGYMGKKHTLDLQKGLAYDAVHDVTGVPKEARSERYAEIFKGYDILLTAMDHKIAEEARKAGLKVFYYDALAWYWPEIPESVRGSDLYLAQDFFGVKERLREVFNTQAGRTAAFTVPPIAPEMKGVRTGEHVLINLGGLQNPFWPIEDVADYARVIVRGLKQALPEGERVVIAGSEAVAQRLKDEGVVTFPRKQMEDVLRRSRVAFMTPGLGNIYDAAAYDLPTIWLPPANDSQGQQLGSIGFAGMCDAALDWDAITGVHIRYSDPQPQVLSRIAEAATRLATDEGAQARLTMYARRCFGQLSAKKGSSSAALLDRFGTGGEREVARHVVEKARGYQLGRV